MYTVKLVGRLLIVSNSNGMVGRMRKYTSRQMAINKFFIIAEYLDNKGLLSSASCIEA
jgi:hypothetical protein